ncbi:hypothetical protein DL767_001759 [Monosporascus sp. MG133]|nr:hypothetical protein DL767_001759 [Monosporascus sp. MG133]
MAALDSNFKVRGTEGRCVVDASVFPCHLTSPQLSDNAYASCRDNRGFSLRIYSPYTVEFVCHWVSVCSQTLTKVARMDKLSTEGGFYDARTPAILREP